MVIVQVIQEFKRPEAHIVGALCNRRLDRALLNHIERRRIRIKAYNLDRAFLARFLDSRTRAYSCGGVRAEDSLHIGICL